MLQRRNGGNKAGGICPRMCGPIGIFAIFAEKKRTVNSILTLLLVSWGIVQTSSVFMRQAPDYESALDSQSRMGTVVQVLDRQGYWVKVRTPEPYEGWVNELCIVPVSEQEKDAWLRAPRYICTEELTRILEAPEPHAARISDFLMGNMVRRGPGRSGAYVEVILPSGRSGWVRHDAVRDFDAWAADCRAQALDKTAPEVTAAALVATARRFVGVPYLWGGMSVKHFDCSGLTGLCYFMQGILLPRDASQQVKCGVEVSVDQMQAGDLVFFGEKRVSHVALCIAPGRIIHSSQLVRINSLDPSAPDAYTRKILHVRRILGHVGDGTGAGILADSPAYFAR